MAARLGIATILTLTALNVAFAPLPLALSRPDVRQARRLAAIDRKLRLIMDHLGVVDDNPYRHT